MSVVKWLAPAAAIVLCASALVASQAAAQDGPPSPTAGTVLTTGLDNPRGMVIGPDGMLYVAEAGTGGDIDVIVEGAPGKSGLTGRISKIDLDTGVRTTVVDELPSNAGEFGDPVGPADVNFIGNTLYYLQTHAGDAYGFPGTPTGVYKVLSNGTTELIADIGQFNMDNVPPTIEDGSQLDIEVGGNPYSMIVRDGSFFVVDANHNRVIEAEVNGDVSIAAQFPDHPVPTGITYRPAGGPFYVAGLGAFPFAPGEGNVYTVSHTAGDIAEIADGFSMLTDAEIGPASQLYALQFADPASDPNGPPFLPFSGKVLKVNADGSMTPVVGGLTFPGAIIFDGNTAYITNNGLSVVGPGEIVKIENFSSASIPVPVVTATPATQPPPAPVATATRPSGIVAPDTGSGGFGGSGTPMAFIAALFAGVVACAGGAVALRRR